MKHLFKKLSWKFTFCLGLILAALSLDSAVARTVMYASVYNAYGPGADILKIDENGNSSIWNTGLTLEDPEGMALDSNGNLYVNDGAYVYKIDPAGNGTVFATKPTPYYAYGLAVDSSNNVYAVGEAGNFYVLYRYAPDGSALGTWSLGFDATVGITFGSDGNLYAVETFGGTVGSYNSSGVRSDFASGLAAPYGLAFDASGNLFVSGDYNPDVIWKIGPDGTSVTPFATTGTISRGLAIDADGKLYSATQAYDVDDNLLNFIMVTDSDGNTSEFAALTEEQRPNFIVVVPEPATWFLAVMGLGFLVFLKWSEMRSFLKYRSR